MTNKIVLITGATSGIGAEFAKRFAAKNYDLIITGRRESKIKALAEELTTKYKINVEVIISELTNDKDLIFLEQKILTTKNIEILINNAGFTQRGLFVQGDLAFFEDYIKVHAIATMRLTKAALVNMLPNKNGIIINVSSMGSFIPFPNNCVYVSSKAFVSLFSETLSLELKVSGIKIQSLCPGMTATDIFEKMGEDPIAIANSRSWFYKVMTSEEVVNASLKCLEKNKTVCIPGFRNKLLTYYKTFKRFFN